MLKTLCLILLACAATTACGRTLYHYHRTVVGLDISGNVAGDTPSGHLTLGYSRRLVILMPPEIQTILDTEAKAASIKLQSQREAKTTSSQLPFNKSLPDTVFCTQVKASLGGVNSFREILATGDPAYGYSQRLVGVAISAADDLQHNFVCPQLQIPAAYKTDVNTPTNSATETKSGS